jgi:hypothetical protein
MGKGSGSLEKAQFLGDGTTDEKKRELSCVDQIKLDDHLVDGKFAIKGSAKQRQQMFWKIPPRIVTSFPSVADLNFVGLGFRFTLSPGPRRIPVLDPLLRLDTLRFHYAMPVR